jgi:hypothetical protein
MKATRKKASRQGRAGQGRTGDLARHGCIGDLTEVDCAEDVERETSSSRSSRSSRNSSSSSSSRARALLMSGDEVGVHAGG